MRFIRRNLGLLLSVIVFLLIVGIGSYELLQRQPAPPTTRSGTLAFRTNRDANFEIYSWTVTERKATRLTNNPGDDSNPAFSPNGALVAYERWQDGQADIIVADAVNGVGGPINLPDTSETEPDWHPNGNMLAYVSDAGDTPSIYVLDRATDTTRRVTGDEGVDSSPSWSADGKQLVFASNRAGTNDIYILDVTKCQAPAEDAPANTAETCEITPLIADGAENIQPDWSPNGRWIAFVSNRDTRQSIYVVNPRGRRLERITSGQADTEPAWAPDSERMAYTTTLPSGETAVQVYGLNSRVTEAITAAGEIAGQSAWRPEPVVD